MKKSQEKVDKYLNGTQTIFNAIVTNSLFFLSNNSKQLALMEVKRKEKKEGGEVSIDGKDVAKCVPKIK